MIFRHWNYMGACFQASHCHTQTMTNGNALCSLISFILQHITLTRSYKVMYQHVCDEKEKKNIYNGMKAN